MKVAIALHPRWIITSEVMDGATRSAFNQLKYFNQHGLNTRLYGNITLKADKIQKAITLSFLGKRDPLYYLSYFLMNQDSDIFLGVSFPELGLFRPSKTIIQFRELSHVLRLIAFNKLKERYKKLNYAFNSNYLKNRYLEIFKGIPELKCHTVYNGVDTELFSPTKHRENFDKKNVIFAGQWSKEKGIYVLFKAIKILNSRRKDIRFLLVGSSFIWQTRKSLKWNRLNQKMTSRIISKLDGIEVIGPVNHPDMAGVFNRGDVFVYPSTCEEAFGNALAEAMACGLPCIASKIGGIPEVIGNEGAAVMIEPNDGLTLADNIEYLLDNEEEMRKIGKLARKRILDNFTWRLHVEEFNKIFKTIYEG